MTFSELRSIALVIKNRVTALHEAVSPAFNEVDAWTLNSDDASLPTIAKVKAVVLAFEQIDKPSLLLYDEIRAVKTASDTAATLPDSLGITWEDILDKPSVALAGHPHVKADVSDFAHTHVKANILDFPANLGKAAYISWAGNATYPRQIALPFAIYGGILYATDGKHGMILPPSSYFAGGSGKVVGVITTDNSALTLTITANFNAAAIGYGVIIWGAS